MRHEPMLDADGNVTDVIGEVWEERKKSHNFNNLKFKYNYYNAL